MKVFNRLKEFADSRGLTAYALWKATTLSEPTVYRLYKDPTLIPSGKVLEGLSEAFPDTTPNDWLKFEVESDTPHPEPEKRSRRGKSKSELKSEPMKLKRGQVVKIPSGARAWVDKVFENGQVALTVEGIGEDVYPVHMLTITDCVV